MKITVKVSTKAKSNSVEKISDRQYKVKTTTPAVNNKANLAVIKLLADYFNIKKSAISIISGITYVNKVFKIDIN